MITNVKMEHYFSVSELLVMEGNKTVLAVGQAQEHITLATLQMCEN